MKKEVITLILGALIIQLTGFSQNFKPTFSMGDFMNPYSVPFSSYTKTGFTYTNPVIPGFYSDPSVCRVGEDYYLVTSTFEYFPGVPVFHSKDLITWEQIGHCIDRKEQLPMGLDIYAATIRYNQGIFYMITTNMSGKGGNFYVTAKDPAGPWSDPIWVDISGYDPDLFFDDNGKVYTTSSSWKLYEIEIKSGKLLDEGRKIWYGTGGRVAEGPHIYKKDGYYYLMAAEGGTAEAHSETIARGIDVRGPYVNNPANPILTHANSAGMLNAIQGIGHGDLVQAHDDSWWMVFHGYRSVTGQVHHLLRRETCLVPVSWPKNGWPAVNGNGTVTLKMDSPTLPLKSLPAHPSKINFDSNKLGLEWNYILLPDFKYYSLEERPGFLRIKGSSLKIGDEGSPSFVGRRMQDMFFTATTQLAFDPQSKNEEAGMTLVNNGIHFDLMVQREDGQRYVRVKLQFGTTIYKSDKMVLKPGPVKLRIKGEKTKFIFSFAQGEEEFKEIESLVSTYLSSETVGGFTGVYVGLYATGNGKECKSAADYNWFEYLKDESPAQQGMFSGF
jgi:xylan 1,4-beta-xylosidase